MFRFTCPFIMEAIKAFIACAAEGDGQPVTETSSDGRQIRERSAAALAEFEQLCGNTGPLDTVKTLETAASVCSWRVNYIMTHHVLRELSQTRLPHGYALEHAAIRLSELTMKSLQYPGICGADQLGYGTYCGRMCAVDNKGKRMVPVNGELVCRPSLTQLRS